MTQALPYLIVGVVLLAMLFMMSHIMRLQDKINRLDCKLSEHLSLDDRYDHRP